MHEQKLFVIIWQANIFCRIGQFLLSDLPRLLEDVPLTVRARIWHMRDDAPCCATSSQ
jgi:hypothetical protein